MTRKSHNKRVALFPGSFNPFTRGHQRIVERALSLFDNVIILFGININKPETDEAMQAELASVKELYASDERVSVEAYKGLTVDAARDFGADAILRGVRNVSDFEYERNMADINMKLSGIETVILVAEPQMALISSSMVRELASYGADVSDYLPKK